MNRLKKVLEELPIFLATIPLFVLVHIEQEFHHLIRYQFVYREILELLFAAIIIIGFGFFIIRPFRRAAIFAMVLMLVFYFFCDLKDWLHKINPSAFYAKYIFLLPFVIFILVISFIRIRKSRSDFRNSYLFINSLFILFILSDCVIMFAIPVFKKNEFQNPNVKTYEPCNNCIKPDIYYLVFDAYTSSQVLKKEFGYDNHRLDSFLSQSGFYLIPHSVSNYNLTPFSIGSCFNLDYIRALNTSQDFYIKEYLPGISAVYQSEIVPILEKQGYEIINHSVFNIKNHPSDIPLFDLWELNILYQRHNILRKTDADIGWLFPSWLRPPTFGSAHQYAQDRDDHFQRTLNAILHTAITPDQRPRFVYGHILVPHGPYTFDSSGRKIPVVPGPFNIDEDKKSYLQQLVYTNSVITQIVHSIISHSMKPIVIIIQGDHGYKYHDLRKKQVEFANLNAFYFYNRDYHLLTDSMSSVNTFRVVLNTLFKQQLPMLPDTSYFLQYK